MTGRAPGREARLLEVRLESRHDEGVELDSGLAPKLLNGLVGGRGWPIASSVVIASYGVGHEDHA